MIHDVLEPWGLLPLALPLLLLSSARFTAWLLPEAPRVDRLAALGVMGMVQVHALVGTLGTFGVLTTNTLLASLLGVLLLSLTCPVETLAPGMGRFVRQHPLPLLLASVPVALALVAARLLPVWQWDSVGYHLPFVNFVIQSGGFSELPPDLRYITTYPHDIELGMVALRLLLPDDRLVDLAQLPYGLVGATLTTALARKLRAGPRADATFPVLAGALWLFVPCVFLQLPTNYVDVGTAAALLGAVYFLLFVPVSWRTLLLGGLALGLFLGSKPSAPLATAVLGAAAAWRCWQARALVGFALFAVAVLLFGAEMYLVMLVRHGNPVWPVAVHLGPLSLPGTHAVSELLAAGAALPSASGTTLERLLVSWLAVTTPAVFDMKLGGLGLPFLLALPLAVLGLVRRRSAPVVVALVATLASPDPSLGRYVLAFAGVVLALALAELEAFPLPRAPVLAAATAVAALQLTWNVPGLTGDGPTLAALWHLDDAQRRVAVGPHGAPSDYPRVWEAVARGESVAFDEDFEFPGLLWSPRLAYPVHALPPTSDAAALARWAAQQRVRVLAVGAALGARLPADAWVKLFDCRSAECAVYVRASEVASAGQTR